MIIMKILMLTNCVDHFLINKIPLHPEISVQFAGCITYKAFTPEEKYTQMITFIKLNCVCLPCLYRALPSPQAHDVIITSSLRQKDVATSFRRKNCVINEFVFHLVDIYCVDSTMQPTGTWKYNCHIRIRMGHAIVETFKLHTHTSWYFYITLVLWLLLKFEKS